MPADSFLFPCGYFIISGMKNTDKTKPFYDPESILVVVNKKCAWPNGYVPKDLVPASGIENRIQSWTLRREAAEALAAMAKAAAEENVRLMIQSGYRDTDFQRICFEKSCRDFGFEQTLLYSAKPGHSEHHTGLAVDFDTEVHSVDLTEAFEDTVQSAWLRKHAHEFGFILRYPMGKKTITGYAYEPWHYRYIGKKEAAKMYAAGETVTMEEFYGIPGGDYEEM